MRTACCKAIAGKDIESIAAQSGSGMREVRHARAQRPKSRETSQISGGADCAHDCLKVRRGGDIAHGMVCQLQK